MHYILKPGKVLNKSTMGFSIYQNYTLALKHKY